MQNEPNLQNTQMNLNPVKTKDYMKNDAFSHRKNEPNLRQTNPIYKTPKKYEKVKLFTPLFSKKQNFSQIFDQKSTTFHNFSHTLFLTHPTQPSHLNPLALIYNQRSNTPPNFPKKLEAERIKMQAISISA